MTIVLTYKVAIHNPCNNGNNVIFRDLSQIEIGTVQIMSGWSNKIVDLTDTYTDLYSLEGG